MQSKYFLVLCFLSAVLCQAGQSCSEKAILSNDQKLLYENYADKTLVFNDVASCVSLKTDEDKTCCYIKTKFENELLDEKFTHEGCIEINNIYLYDDVDVDIDDVIDGMLDDSHDYVIPEATDGEQIVFKKFEIDCSSRFIQMAGIALLLFLL